MYVYWVVRKIDALGSPGGMITYCGVLGASTCARPRRSNLATYRSCYSKPGHEFDSWLTTIDEVVGIIRGGSMLLEKQYDVAYLLATIHVFMRLNYAVEVIFSINYCFEEPLLH